MAVRTREVLARPWVGVCVPQVCTIFNAIRIKFNLFFINYCISHISKQIKQRTRIGKIFARWHLAIAITSLRGIFKSSSTITLEIPFHQRNKCRSENETIVNLRNRREETRRRQTLCDNLPNV